MQHADLPSFPSQGIVIASLQQLLIDLLGMELNIQQELHIHQNFFDLGCRSLNLRILQMNLQRQLGCTIPITTFYAYPTIEMLAGHLSTLQLKTQA